VGVRLFGNVLFLQQLKPLVDDARCIINELANLEYQCFTRALFSTFPISDGIFDGIWKRSDRVHV
jgi:hypothetical protein